jgi:hypothetical protein
MRGRPPLVGDEEMSSIRRPPNVPPDQGRYDSEEESSQSISPDRSLSPRPHVLYRDARTADLPIPQSPADIQSLMDELLALREENERLKQGSNDLHESKRASRLPYTSHVFHDVRDVLYLDEPHYEHRPVGGLILCASIPIRSDRHFLRQHPEIAFAIYKKYRRPMSNSLSKVASLDGVFQIPTPSSESISLVAEDMQYAVEEFVEQVPFFHHNFPDFDSKQKLQSPYMFMFYSSPFLKDILLGLDPTSQDLLQQLDSTIHKSYGREYELARNQAEHGVVSRHLMRYLIRPGDVLIEGGASESSQAWISTSWLETFGEINKERNSEEWRSARKQRTPMRSGMSEIAGHDKISTYGWDVSAWAWQYDGVFEKQYKTLRIYMWNTREEEAVNITSLSIYPLKYAPPQVRASFEQRGRMFWSLRNWRFISYLREDDELHNVRPYTELDKQY